MIDIRYSRFLGYYAVCISMYSHITIQYIKSQKIGFFISMAVRASNLAISTDFVTTSILSAFAKLRKATNRLVMFIRLSVLPHGTTRLPLDEFSWNLIFKHFSKICRANSSLIGNLTRITGNLHEDVYNFMLISRSVPSRARNVSGKRRR
jgi:hypothetical protein